jgi:hypothetical protein
MSPDELVNFLSVWDPCRIAFLEGGVGGGLVALKRD